MFHKGSHFYAFAGTHGNADGTLDEPHPTFAYDYQVVVLPMGMPVPAFAHLLAKNQMPAMPFAQKFSTGKCPQCPCRKNSNRHCPIVPVLGNFKHLKFWKLRRDFGGSISIIHIIKKVLLKVNIFTQIGPKLQFW